MRIKTKIKLTNKALSRQYMIFVPAAVVDVLGNIRKKVEKYSTVVLVQIIIL